MAGTDGWPIDGQNQKSMQTFGSGGGDDHRPTPTRRSIERLIERRNK